MRATIRTDDGQVVSGELVSAQISDWELSSITELLRHWNNTLSTRARFASFGAYVAWWDQSPMTVAETNDVVSTLGLAVMPGEWLGKGHWHPEMNPKKPFQYKNGVGDARHLLPLDSSPQGS